MIYAKKHLGQHFLTDKNIARKIVDLLPDNNLPTLEIGAGTGILTDFLIKKYPKSLHVIEIDKDACEIIIQKFPELENRIYQKDFLKINLKSILHIDFMVIGNFPYNISSSILFKLVEHRNRIPFIVGMFQKEVAERIAASHNSKQYGILSVWVQMFYKIEYCFTVNENVFFPPPKVKSGVIKLERINRNLEEVDENLLFRIIKTGFNQRRKTLRNSLSSIIDKSLTTHEIFYLRPEQLSIDDFIWLTKFIFIKI